MEIFSFDFNCLSTNPPRGFTVKTANNECLILDRIRDGYHERFAVAKTGERKFSLFRLNLHMTAGDKIFTQKNLIITSRLPKILALLGYKTGALTKGDI